MHEHAKTGSWTHLRTKKERCFLYFHIFGYDGGPPITKDRGSAPSVDNCHIPGKAVADRASTLASLTRSEPCLSVPAGTSEASHNPPRSRCTSCFSGSTICWIRVLAWSLYCLVSVIQLGMIHDRCESGRLQGVPTASPRINFALFFCGSRFEGAQVVMSHPGAPSRGYKNPPASRTHPFH
ncbi:hypothetical protein CISG_00438 [Coccidioides immitis RMSCC 3703]|uniref:Uncharacterized protein n=2 Tax=Coccidioides immitis TaxID=5501 RepID=A0A0J8QIF1_COCIT|nr:hypothetical protein CIRG_07098 [Coccidioides immitis RMSCC 2394]KMU72129.1 hypothetical protein CISG_00438 [Coccidioides immitis RMSCC 3703]